LVVDLRHAGGDRMTPLDQQFQDLRTAGGFGCIYADPPWAFENYSAKGEAKNPNQHYPCMDVDDLEEMPVRMLAAKNCWLVMWATFPMLPQALRVMDQWGFDYRAGACWVKLSKLSQADSDDAKMAFGPGYVFRSAAELLLVGARGSPKLLKEPGSRSHRNVILAPVREHSRKPHSAYDLVEARFPGPYIELFARNTRRDWASWGNEVNKHDRD
jgi:N6-adenosine-specific RNA methylase IME4